MSPRPRDKRRPRSATYIQRRIPGLSLEGAQLQSAFEHEPPLPPAFTPPTLEGPHVGPLPAHHGHVSLEGPQAAARRRPHISLEGPRAPIRSALEARYRLEGTPADLIQHARLNPALIHHHRSK